MYNTLIKYRLHIPQVFMGSIVPPCMHCGEQTGVLQSSPSQPVLQTHSPALSHSPRPPHFLNKQIQFKISKVYVYDIGLQRYRNLKIRVWKKSKKWKNSILEKFPYNSIIFAYKRNFAKKLSLCHKVKFSVSLQHFDIVNLL